MEQDQRNARIFGVLFIITFLTSIPALALFQPVLDDPAGYIAGGGKDNQIYLGAFLELLLIIANVGTAVVVFPILRRQNELLAVGYVAARIIESVFIGAGIIFVLGVVTLRQDSPDAADLAVSLAALKDWTFLFGPGFIVPFGNGLILGYLMYTSGLVPRRMAMLGLIGGPLLLVGSIGTLFDWWSAGTTVPAILVIPEFVWELSLGIYAAVWGFRRDSPILSPEARRPQAVEPAT
jgi:nitric oxide reductase large subunit